MFKLIHKEGTVTLEPVEMEDMFNDDTDHPIVTDETGAIIQELLDKNGRLAQKLAGNAKFIASQLKPAMHQAYLEGAQAMQDVLFEAQVLGESVEMPLPYAPGDVL